MADQPAIVTKLFNRMGAGVAPTAPPNSIDPEAQGEVAWRDGQNLVELDGTLRPRPGIVPLSTEVGMSALPYSFSATLQDGEVPLQIYSIDEQASSLIVVTNRQLWKYHGTWINVTPTYADGTVTATNGSPNITGAGTLWLTRVITGGQHIELEGRWYKLSSVTGEGAAALTENFAGATGGGKAYTIRRNWSGGSVVASNISTDLIFSTIYNGSLYVAGPVAVSGTVGAGEMAVIRVDDILTDASTVGVYLTATRALVAGLDVITDLWLIRGIKMLQDGRVVIVGLSFAAGTPLSGAVVFYSSHLNDAVWTVAPGGRTVMADMPDITALGQLGGAITLHHENGVKLAHLTGLADPPLTYQETTAQIGCYSPRSLKRYGSVEVFVSREGGIAIFDGGGSKTVDRGLAKYLRDGATSLKDLGRSGFHAFLDARINRYVLVQWRQHDSTMYAYDLEQGFLWKWECGLPISAGSDSCNDPQVGQGDILIKHRAFLGSASLDGATEVEIMRVFVDGSADTKYTNGTAVTHYVESDDQDFGDPLAHKTIEKVIAWFRPLTASGGPDTPIISASVDGGVTWVDKTLSITLSSNLDKQIEVQASFLGELAASRLLRVKLSWAAGDQPLTTCTRMLMVAQKGGSVEQTGISSSGS